MNSVGLCIVYALVLWGVSIPWLIAYITTYNEKTSHIQSALAGIPVIGILAGAYYFLCGIIGAMYLTR